MIVGDWMPGNAGNATVPTGTRVPSASWGYWLAGGNVPSRIHRSIETIKARIVHQYSSGLSGCWPRPTRVGKLAAPVLDRGIGKEGLRLVLSRPFVLEQAVGSTCDRIACGDDGKRERRRRVH